MYPSLFLPPSLLTIPREFLLRPLPRQQQRQQLIHPGRLSAGPKTEAFEARARPPPLSPPPPPPPHYHHHHHYQPCQHQPYQQPHCFTSNPTSLHHSPLARSRYNSAHSIRRDDRRHKNNNKSIRGSVGVRGVGQGEGVSARGRTVAGSFLPLPPACNASERVHFVQTRKNELDEGEEQTSPPLVARHLLSPYHQCLFPSFWILYRERYAKVCMHEGRSNGQESREFVRSTAARIRRIRYWFLFDFGTRETQRHHVLFYIIVAAAATAVVFVVFVVFVVSIIIFVASLS